MRTRFVIISPKGRTLTSDSSSGKTSRPSERSHPYSHLSTSLFSRLSHSSLLTFSSPLHFISSKTSSWHFLPSHYSWEVNQIERVDKNDGLLRDLVYNSVYDRLTEHLNVSTTECLNIGSTLVYIYIQFELNIIFSYIQFRVMNIFRLILFTECMITVW